ncbi:unnamed protein product [Brassicogethes aeneus]|uniref:Uncharacterized protein n=1 Tax=Brassicogethes aeneus TaxID=1431903 RepID=A0A9P0AT10_BRAAE|nr:unnamed protein product [Brassicogethes aeneus]
MPLPVTESTDIPADSLNMSNLESALTKVLTPFKAEIKEALNSYCQKLDSLTVVINNVLEENKGLKEQSTILSNNLVKVEEELDSVKSNLLNITEEAVYEVHQRQLRSKNIIIYNVPESTNSNKQQRTQNESEIIKNLISTRVDINCDNLKCFRLGKYSAGKIRPVKVELMSSDDVLKVKMGEEVIGERYRRAKGNGTAAHRSIRRDHTAHTGHLIEVGTRVIQIAAVIYNGEFPSESITRREAAWPAPEDEEIKSVIQSGETPDWDIREFPCHTQAVERCVKLVTEASLKVCGPQSRYGYIRATLKSREAINEFSSK